jgi:putative membrane protein
MMWNRPFDMMPGWGDWGWFWPFHFVGPLLFWGLIIAAIVFVVRRTLWRETSIAGHRGAGLEVLEQRYARGEIGRDEYLQKKADIAG